MSNYEQEGKHFYSEPLDVLLMSLGIKGELGHIMHVVYSGNEAYTKELIEATDRFLDDQFVECNYDKENNIINFLGENNGNTTT